MARTAAWLIELPTCPSTNTWALDHIEGLAHGACVWTRNQTGGRGRNGNHWQSPPGVLTASFVIELERRLNAQQLSLAAGLAVTHAIEDLKPNAPIRIKWPNDCYALDRKIAGILCESSDAGRVVVGIGLNVDPKWEASDQLACSAIALAEILPKPPEMKELLESLRRYLLEADGLISANGWRPLLEQLRGRDWLAGKTVSIETNGKHALGTAAGIDDDGRLLVEHPPGNIVAYASGSVTLASLRSSI